MNSNDEVRAADSETGLNFLVSDSDAGMRLDSYLTSLISGWSRARLQNLIEDEEVLVNGQPAKAAYKIRAKDEIEVDLTPAPAETFTPENIPLDIVFEDDSLVVVNKPAGMVVHPGAGISSGTLANALAFHFAQLSSQGGSLRPGIVHRLDKGTSGLLVAAKTEAAHENLAQQFRARSVFKLYLALVHGTVNLDSGRIEQPIKRDPRNRVRMSVGSSGRSALSLYRVKKRYSRFSFLEVELKTGRTHQIRVHLAWLKHPVVGDDVYGGGRDNTVADQTLRAAIRRLGRQFLHAAELGFTHPVSHAQVKFSSGLPTELLELLSFV